MVEFSQETASAADAVWSNALSPETRAKRRAAKALEEIYGPVAGDPDSALRLQRLRQSEEAFPLEQRGRQLDISGAEQRQRQSEAAFPLEQRGRQLGLSTAEQRLRQSEEAFPLEQRARQLGNERLAGATQDAATARKTAAQLQAARMLAQVESAGGDTLAAFDEIARRAPGIFDSPENALQVRDALATNQITAAQIVDALDPSRTGAGNAHVSSTGYDAEGKQYVVMSDGTTRYTGVTEGRFTQKAPDYRGRVKESEAVGKARGERTAADLPLSQTELAQGEARLAAADQTFAALNRQLDKAIEDTDIVSAGLGAATSFIPGTPAASQAARLKTITGNLINRYVAELKALSANGSTGFGNLTELEAERMAAQYAALDQTQSPGQLREELGYLKQEMQASRARMLQAYRADLAARGQAAAPARMQPESEDGWSVEEVR